MLPEHDSGHRNNFQNAAALYCQQLALNNDNLKFVGNKIYLNQGLTLPHYSSVINKINLPALVDTLIPLSESKFTMRSPWYQNMNAVVSVLSTMRQIKRSVEPEFKYFTCGPTISA